MAGAKPVIKNYSGWGKISDAMLDKLSSRLPQVRGAWQTALILSPRPMVLLVEVKSKLGFRYSIKVG